MTQHEPQATAQTDGQKEPGTTPQLLSVTFKRCGYQLTQLERNQFAALYSVTDIETGKAQGFEVFEIRIQQAHTTAKGISYAHKEIYPNNEAFGNWAKAPSSKDRALELFADFTEKGRAKQNKP